MAQERVKLTERKQASFGSVSSIPDPTGVRARNADNGEDDFHLQGSSGTAWKRGKEGTSSPQPTGGRATNASNTEKSFHMQGNSKISQPPQVTAEELDLAEDLEAMFEGTELSEEFREKATAVFQTAVAAKINEAIEEIHSEMQDELEDAEAELAETLIAKLDSYLDYVVEQWMEENRLAVESGIKTEMSEGFLQGLRDLFSEHYVDLPEEKEDVLVDLAARNEELEEAYNSALEDNIELNSRLAAYERDLVFAEVTEGLTETQISKLGQLTESVSYTDPDEFRTKVETLRESYFPSGIRRDLNEDNNFDEDPLDELNEDVGPKDPSMKAYAAAISRSIRK